MQSQEEKWLLEEKHQGVENEAFYADLERLKNGEPLAYIIGQIPFSDCQIHLDSKPLIPRPETEYWLEQEINAIKESGIDEPRVLDLCAGSGAIGVAVAKALPAARVDLAEVDPDHIPTIQKNLAVNLQDTTWCQVIESDLFTNIEGKYDFILSNPPYIDPELDRTEASVKDYEPSLALYGGEAGLELIEKIIKAAPNYLNENGQLWLEHEPEQSDAIKNLANEAGFASVVTKVDQYGIQRYSVLKLL